MAESMIGRDEERRIFASLLNSGQAELVALYGRRRVGKTFLVRKLFTPDPQIPRARRTTYLEVTGTKDGSAALQRRRCREAIEQAFDVGQPLPDFASWDAILDYLTKLVVKRAAERPRAPIVLFFDELPWLATPRARLLESLDYYWNRHLSRVPNVKVVLCGSAASWMLRRVVHAKGGLHNRITRRMRLDPFTVREANTFLASRKIQLTPTELFELYVALGGVPYYLGLVERGQSISEAIGTLCFERSGALRDEFDQVFASLFSDHEDHIAMLRALAKRKTGVTRNELIAATRLTSGGSLNRRLQELEEAGFIGRVEPFDKKVKTTLYRITDEYTLFYLQWLERAPKGIIARGGAQHWQATSQTPSYRTWTGYAFESICLKHTRELQAALGIENLVTTAGSWRFVPRGGSSLKRQGAQVDLLLDRRDGVINLCEMKYSSEPFVVTKSYAAELRQKMTLFKQHAKPRKRVILTLVSPHGLRPNSWSEDLVDQVLDASALV